MNKYTYFYNGHFSQWYPCSFMVNGVTYNCAEQFMMYNKAMIFDATDIADLIMKAISPREQKRLGRQIPNFDKAQWESQAKAIVYTGNMAKFTQNDDLQELLLATSPTLLVEASPTDTIWGYWVK